MASSGLSCRESPWSALGGPFLSSFAQNGLRKRISGHVAAMALMGSQKLQNPLEVETQCG